MSISPSNIIANGRIRKNVQYGPQKKRFNKNDVNNLNNANKILIDAGLQDESPSIAPIDPGLQDESPSIAPIDPGVQDESPSVAPIDPLDESHTDSFHLELENE